MKDYVVVVPIIASFGLVLVDDEKFLKFFTASIFLTDFILSTVLFALSGEIFPLIASVAFLAILPQLRKKYEFFSAVLSEGLLQGVFLSPDPKVFSAFWLTSIVPVFVLAGGRFQLSITMLCAFAFISISFVLPEDFTGLPLVLQSKYRLSALLPLGVSVFIFLPHPITAITTKVGIAGLLKFVDFIPQGAGVLGVLIPTLASLVLRNEILFLSSLMGYSFFMPIPVSISHLILVLIWCLDKRFLAAGALLPLVAFALSRNFVILPLFVLTIASLWRSRNKRD